VVEGSGLENRRARKGTGGSNPSLSATQSSLQKIPVFHSLKYAKHAGICDKSQTSRTGENGLLG
jgi:hypothetical protein